MINKQKLYSIALVSAAMILMLLSITSAAPFAYITNFGSTTVSVIDTATNTVTATIGGFDYPEGVAVSPDGTKVYVANEGYSTVSVINTTTNKVTATVNVGTNPFGVAVTPDGSKVYVTTVFSNNVSVIDTETSTVTATIPVSTPWGVAVTPDGTKVYVTSPTVYLGPGNVSVIDTANNTITATVNVGGEPFGVAVSPDGTKVYVTNEFSNNVSVIDTETNTVTATVKVRIWPYGIAVSPDGTKVYVTNLGNNKVSVIDTATNTVITNVPVGSIPIGVAVTPDGSKVYVANQNSNNVSVINTTTNSVIQTVNVGNSPNAFGQFIVPILITPIITWNNPADIIYGTALSGTQLNATASVPGTFAYNPQSGTLLNVGQNQQLNTTFTPTDSADYSRASASAFINVTTATPIITWSNPANITYGTPLSSTQLDATSSVPGSFVYTPATGTVLAAGLGQTLSTAFTPTDITNYTTTSASVLINVTPGTPITIGSILDVGTHILTATFTPTDTITYTPTLTWTPNPLASIVYGTPLSITQLDATATYNGQTVPGNFVYTDPIGTAETSGNGGIVQNLITVTPNVQNAALAIVKSAYPTRYDDAGQTITYHYTVTNSGNADISAPITVVDDNFGTVPIQNSGILSPGSSVTRTTTYKTTQSDINAGHVTNAAYATGSFNSQPIISPNAIAIVRYEQPNKKEEHNEEERNGDRDNYGGPGYGGYGSAVIPMIPGPMSSSPMFSSVPNVYTSGPSTTEIQNSESNVHKTKAHLSKHKHKHKHHTTKHHKTGKKALSVKVDKK